MPDKITNPLDMAYCIHCGGYAANDYECRDCQAHDAEIKGKMAHPALVPIIVKNDNGEGKLKFFRRENW
jgi:hypothetical protein